MLVTWLFKKINSNKLILLVSLSALTIRLHFLSPYLEDWDSVQFALALRDFSLVDHTPHPPGYPVYIFINRIINLFVNNEVVTLSLFSAICGSLMAIPFYLLASKITDKITSLLLTILFLNLPITWSLSEVGLTNIPGTTFTVLSAYLLFLGKNEIKFLYLASFLSGLTLGIRFAEYSILISLILLVLVYRKFNGTFFSFLFFSIGILIWLIPMVYDTGLANFIRAYSIHVGYIADHDSLKSSLSIAERIKSIWYLIKLGFSNYFLPLAIFTPIGFVLLIRRSANFSYNFLSTWFISYFVPLLFIYNLEVPRHVLPLVAPLVLILGLVVKNLISMKYHNFFLVFLIILTFIEAFDIVSRFKNTVPPSIQPVLFVKENFTPTNTTLITSFTFRQFQYYLPNYKNYWGATLAPKIVDTEYIILDYLAFKDKLPYVKDYSEVQRKNFTDDKILFPRIPSTNLYIFKKTRKS